MATEKTASAKDETVANGWLYAKEFGITLSGEKHRLQMYEGMSGIGSRAYWLDDKRMMRDAVIHSADLTQGNHFIYRMRWRNTPWDIVDIVIHEQFLPELLNEDNAWRQPQKLF